MPLSGPTRWNGLPLLRVSVLMTAKMASLWLQVNHFGRAMHRNQEMHVIIMYTDLQLATKQQLTL